MAGWVFTGCSIISCRKKVREGLFTLHILRTFCEVEAEVEAGERAEAVGDEVLEAVLLLLPLHRPSKYVYHRKQHPKTMVYPYPPIVLIQS